MQIRRLIRCLLILLIAVILAPLIGGIAFFLVRAAVDAATTGIDDLKGLFVIVIFGTYAVGGPIALLAGLMVAIAAWWRTPTLTWIIGAIVVANLLVLVVQPVIGFGFGGFVINLAMSLFAGIACWLLFRRRLAFVEA